MKINHKSSTIMNWTWRFKHRSMYSLSVTQVFHSEFHISLVYIHKHTHKQSKISDCLNKYIITHVSHGELFISSFVLLFTNIHRWILKCINKFNKSFMFQSKPPFFLKVTKVPLIKETFEGKYWISKHLLENVTLSLQAKYWIISEIM